MKKLAQLSMSPEELDKQSLIKIDKWLNFNSEECRDKDPDIAFTKKCLNIGFETKSFYQDRLGRIWLRNREGYFCPFHFEYGNKLYGLRLAANAAN